MTIATKTLTELYEYKDKLEELSTFARLYNGKINLGGKTVTTEELQEELSNIKSEIAAQISQSKLRKIK